MIKKTFIMITLAWYLLKVIICSGILCGYYFLALRNKAFHRWNRFYLLAAIVISLLVPIMKINIFSTGEDKGTVVQVLQTISYGDEAVIEYSHNSDFQLSTENIIEGAFMLISAVFLFIFLLSIYKIKRLRKKYPETRIEDISFINTSEKGTPFSFFNSIFWNEAIDLHSKSGQQIFNHEIAHVKEKHSYDKIFMNIVLIIFWINPFFWLMRKELYMIHEFIADNEALEDSDINAFAEMILQTIYPGQHFSSTNNFFYSPIKRRILMLTKNKNPKVNYISRLLVLPLAAIVFFAFTLKVKNNNGNLYNGKTITVVIDAGHGGKDFGAKGGNVEEKEITLAVAKKVEELNSNKKINIVLSRDNDEYISVHDRASFTNTKKADLFISIHVDAIMKKGDYSGLSVLIPQAENPYISQSKLLGSSIINSFKGNYPLHVANDLTQRETGVWVLKAVECPSVIFETGFMTTPKDLEYLSQPSNQETVAQNILTGINNYEFSLKNGVDANFNTKVDGTPGAADTIPSMYYKNKKVTGLKVSEAKNEVFVKYNDGSKETITKEEAKKRGFILPPPPPPGLSPAYLKSNALFVIDGKVSTSDKAKKVDPNNIKSFDVLKDKAAKDKYGEKGKNGVIEITTKKDVDFTMIADTIRIGHDSSAKPFSQNINLRGKAFYIDSKFPEGALIFVDGKEYSEEEMKKIDPTNIKSISILKGETAVEKYGTKGKDGAIEITTKSENVTIVHTDAKTIYGSPSTKRNDTLPDKIFTKVEIKSQFPGGTAAWQKYV